MKKRFLKIVIGIVLVCILFVGFLYANNNIGMTSTNLETDIRSSQKIKDDWTLDGSVSNTMAAYISYSQDMSDHTFSVYVNRPGLSFGYFFRGGGTLSGIQRGIVEFTVSGIVWTMARTRRKQKAESISPLMNVIRPPWRTSSFWQRPAMPL